MHVQYDNVNHAIAILPQRIMRQGQMEDSRNGKVVTYPLPLTVTTARPMERVLLCPRRRANPFLFLLDGLSILSRVNLLKPFSGIVPRFKDYSDDGETIRGHYGKRLADQIPLAIKMLREDPKSRRVTMSIWNSVADLGADSKDIPCNVHVNLRVVDGALDLTVFNRSNDVLWGMLGANIVQFSFLQEYIASMVGIPTGLLHQISTNAHIYTEFGPGKGMLDFTHTVQTAPCIPLDTNSLIDELNVMFMWLASSDFEPHFEPCQSGNRFIDNVVFPMLAAWHQRDLTILDVFEDCDWFQAARMYGVK
jgi:Thymidylate synthase